MLQQTVYESGNPLRRPSCGSISFNVDSFEHYYTSQKHSNKLFTNPSTLPGGPSCGSISFNVDLFGYQYISQKHSNKPFINPLTLCGGFIFIFCPYANFCSGPPCGLICFIVDLYGYYYMLRKCSNKLFMNCTISFSGSWLLFLLVTSPLSL
ncbi:uncharacterized protein LACBIDRAFT_319115 [Laccaria bicolor S238N-H82]|uniref:Predicted protein n=1 Tax=Laccaria bicolor (strain S238N-H82 / ATCC MYA-4686) TaxID=486041 RepID=B0D7X1_LACBS|nr:uncharacterized protein LACBIDRAFT_319115 [Laccaria bicolor S238N-H82]EDR09480.1 predicted protein [Laccaria bicolor S238N-H82]|eukprot:XP_001879829.1 predicted protein [Laccaria bicolor S238N-H82]